MEVTHVKAHEGQVGNEKADVLAKKGAKLRHKLMLKSMTANWFRFVIEKYWDNRL